MKNEKRKATLMALFLGLGVPGGVLGCAALISALRPLPYEQTPEKEFEDRKLIVCETNFVTETRCCVYADEQQQHCTMMCAGKGDQDFGRQDFNCLTGDLE